MKIFVSENSLPQCPGRDCSTHRGQCKNFKSFPGWDLGQVFHQGGIKKTNRGWYENSATITATIFWNFLMFYKIFPSEQVKQFEIISNKYDIYKLLYELSNIKLKPKGSSCIENELLYRYCDQRKNILKIFYYYCAISGPTILIIF